MAVSSEANSEYLDIKVFLYKYTPDFQFISEDTEAATTLVNGQISSEKVEKPYQVSQYNIALNAYQYFSKFDITPFAKSYRFQQSLYGGDYNWSLVLQDVIIPFAELSPSSTSTVRKAVQFRDPNGRLTPAPGPFVRTDAQSNTTLDLIDLMAQYESEETYPTSFLKDVDNIETAFLARGTGQVPYQSTFQESVPGAAAATVQSIFTTFGNTPANQVSGLRLGDLVQKYNFISVFVYKGSVSAKQAQQALFPTGKVPPKNELFDPSNEVHLMLAGYKNEFNGFVTSKNWNRGVSQVDTITVAGQGALRLFSDTLTLYDPALIAGGMYGAAALMTIAPGTIDDGSLSRVSLFQNLFQNLDPVQILGQLLDLVYRISFTSAKFGSTSSTEFQGFFNLQELTSKHSTSPLPSLAKPAGASLPPLAAQNMFTIPPFLLACVMALRNYNYNLTNTTAGQAAKAYFTQQGFGPLVPGEFGGSNNDPDVLFKETPLNTFDSTKFSEDFGGPCVQISNVAQQFSPFFLKLKEGWSSNISSLKTPNEVMQESLASSLMEFYERPNGRVILRTPQYNQPGRTLSNANSDSTGNLITTDAVTLISASYSEDGTALWTQKRGSWGADLIGNFSDLIQPAYGNGKLMMQYGFREDTVESNPVLKPIAAKQQQAGTFGLLPTSSQTPGNALGISGSGADINALVHKYVRFLLEFDNAGRRVGSLTTKGDPSIEVGKLFYDKLNSKIGYVVDVQKNLTVGGTYQATVGLKFVRDGSITAVTVGQTPIAAGFNSGKNVPLLNNFRQLPTLEELVTTAGETAIGQPSISIMEFNSPPKPTSSLAQATNQLLQNLGNVSIFKPS